MQVRRASRPDRRVRLSSMAASATDNGSVTNEAGGVAGGRVAPNVTEWFAGRRRLLYRTWLAFGGSAMLGVGARWIGSGVSGAGQNVAAVVAFIAILECVALAPYGIGKSWGYVQRRRVLSTGAWRWVPCRVCFRIVHDIGRLIVLLDDGSPEGTLVFQLATRQRAKTYVSDTMIWAADNAGRFHVVRFDSSDELDLFRTPRSVWGKRYLRRHCTIYL